MSTLDPLVLIVGSLALVLGGFVKGAIGVGLPVVAIAVLANFLPAPLVLAIVTLPILLTNLWQAVNAGNAKVQLRRFWPMIVALLVFLWFSARLVVTLDAQVLYGLIGVAVVTFAVTDYFRFEWRVSPAAERWGGPLAGALGGFLGGVSTIWGPPMMMYFVMLRLPKESYIQAVGIVWFIASVPLVLAYIRYGILTLETAKWSALACIPGFLGLGIGQYARRYINQEMFRKILLLFLFVVGLNLLRRALI